MAVKYHGIDVKFANLVKARFPFVYIPTWEEDRALQMIFDAAENPDFFQSGREVYVWSQTTGIRKKGEPGKNNNTVHPSAAIDFAEKTEENMILVLKDFHVFFGTGNRAPDYALIRRLRDYLSSSRSSGMFMKTIVFLSPVLVLPEDMQKEITVLEFPLPTADQIHSVMDDLIETNADVIQVDLDESERRSLAKAALGLTLQEAENAFSKAMVELKGLNRKAFQTVMEEKNQVIRKTGILEFIKSDLSLEDIGGLENLKKWLLKRKDSWSERAAFYHLPAPKGVLITGVPGCGKSLTAKAMSAIWELPLLKMDMGRIFSGVVGSSEENMRKAIATAEAVAPSILWIDEIEKGFASGGEATGDGGTSARVFASFLTWMQEKESPVFVIATANNIRTLPPELLRKGRFDEIFFLDLPTFSERKKIFELHIRKKICSCRAGENFVITEELLEHLARISEGFVGAEIEQVIYNALYEAFFEKRKVLPEDIEQAVAMTIPLSVTQKEQIKELREWANIRAVAATAKEDLKQYQVSEQARKEDKEGDINTSRGGRLLDF